MPAWGLLLVPASLVLLAGLLALTAWLERSVLSPRSLIVSTIRSRAVEPEQVERFVAEQYERLLRELPRVLADD